MFSTTDIAWTFQTLDKDGMVLNMAQTWHQLRPGEVRGGERGRVRHPILHGPAVEGLVARACLSTGVVEEITAMDTRFHGALIPGEEVVLSCWAPPGN